MEKKSESSIDLDEEYKSPLLEKVIGDKENQVQNYNKAIYHYLHALDKLRELFDQRTNELAKDFGKAKKLIENVGIPCHLNLSLCYMKLSEWKKCIYECDKVLQIDKSNTKALFRRSRAYAEINDFIKAKEDYNILIKLHSNSSEIEGIRKIIEEKEINQINKTKNPPIINRLVSYRIINPFINLVIDIGYRKPKSICIKTTQMIATSVNKVKYILIDYPLNQVKSSLNILYRLSFERQNKFSSEEKYK